ncbi:MAG: NAD-dependent DNA ligase LigA, partial [Deltaproteobacteria bacterium]|nr:NAD-dependent DNA ligase LigA [Deltaproteobacteria bacterium]
MNPQQAEKIILDIRERIERFNDEYYQLGQSSIEDDAFDVMLEQLVRLEDQFPQFDRADSPSKRVGGGAVNDFKQVDHRHPMLSLDNLYSQDDLSQWFQGLRKQLKGEPFNLVCELKIDGFAVAVRYSEGKIAQAVTRGNGETGDDVTSNVKTIKTLPMGLAEKLSLEVRGEIFLPKSRFDQINLSRAREEQDLF